MSALKRFPEMNARLVAVVLVATALSFGAFGTAKASAAGWDIHVNMIGAGSVSGTDAMACSSSATEPGQSGGACNKHYTVHPKVCTFLGCVGGPDPRPIEISAHPPSNWNQDVVWEGCNGTAGNVCTLQLPFPGLNTVKGRTVTVRFTDADRDDDGHVGPDDCNDRNPRIYKGAPEIPDNGIDENCDGVDGHDADQDDDSYNETVDCNDHDPNIHPGAVDIPRNGVDEDCTGGDNRDADNDGYDDPPNPGEPRDCNDHNANIRPGAFDTPDNGIDENCDGKDAERPDRDSDGYARPADCDDSNPLIHPTARDKPRNGVDEDCDGRDADFPPIPSDVRHSEKGKGAFTLVRRLTVLDPPGGATVKLTCRGRGCPLRKRTVKVVPGMEQIQLARHFRRARLARGTRIEVSVTAPEMYGKVLRLAIRKHKPPSVTWLKVDPVTHKVTPW